MQWPRSFLWLSLVLHPISIFFALLPCMYVCMYVSQLASNSSLCLLKIGGTISILHYIRHHPGTVLTLSWPCGPILSLAGLLMPLNLQSSAQKLPPSALLSLLLPLLVSFFSVPPASTLWFRGQTQGFPSGSVLWEPLNSSST